MAAAAAVEPELRTTQLAVLAELVVAVVGRLEIMDLRNSLKRERLIPEAEAAAVETTKAKKLEQRADPVL